MSTVSTRERLSRQLNELPDDIVDEIADFTAFVLARRQISAKYLEWNEGEWNTFSLGQFLREMNDDVEYTIEDAAEVYGR